jgi:hypothetical protein
MFPFIYAPINVKPEGEGKGRGFDNFLKKIVKIHTPRTPPLVKKGNISPPGAGKICFIINPYTGKF